MIFILIKEMDMSRFMLKQEIGSISDRKVMWQSDVQKDPHVGHT